MTAPAVTHTFVSAKSDGVDNTFVQPSNWNSTHTVLVDSATLLGRSSTGRGQFESIAPDASLSLSGGILGVIGAAGSFSLFGTLTRSSLASEVGYAAGNLNDYNPTGLSTASTIRLDATSAGQVVTITGLQGGVDGRIMTIINVGSTYNVIFKDQSPNSQVANRFFLNGDITLQTGRSMTMRYDGSSSVWRLLGPASAGSIGAISSAGDTMSGAFNFAPRVSVASAAPTPIGAAASNNVQVTGTTTITAFDSIASGAFRWVEFSGALTLTHNGASLILPGAANITTAAGDCALFSSEGSGNWRCLWYDKVVEGPANRLFNNLTNTISVGFTVTPNNAGTKSSGTYTPDPTVGNYQFITNNGAFTLAAPGSDCAIDILITNGASAGAITFSGFTVGASTGDALTTTNTNVFLLMIRRINGTSTYLIKALQ